MSCNEYGRWGGSVLAEEDSVGAMRTHFVYVSDDCGLTVKSGTFRYGGFGGARSQYAACIG
jgi:hypothetical protein